MKKFFLHFLSHYPDGAEDAAGRAASTPCSPDHAVPGAGLEQQEGCSNLGSAPTWHQPGTELGWQEQGWMWMGSTATYAVLNDLCYKFCKLFNVLNFDYEVIFTNMG